MFDRLGRMSDFAWQSSLLGACAPSVDEDFDALVRTELSAGAWVDHLPGWLQGADEVFATALQELPWGQRTQRLHGQDLLQPRLTASIPVADPPAGLEILPRIGRLLDARYGRHFERVGANLYRDGRDSVAWHGDRIARDLPQAVIAIVSLGEPRTFRLRPRDGGASIGFSLGAGDLLVMGGSCQRTWQHTVPKVASAGPRISLTYRHAYP
ncbi:alpha-ketoglutarate-dependent dioxygenase AlkB [Egicoccus halophilus]|uniref:Alkylated DNA repair protein n=1 Tax=Egicoccus halophilus TaxID=1670830 RepID=A0A8J3A9M2_9ACTN|nr:alpha-ketoglutarate-dependent dioxygenase AlkB [Egicoccus halophilus]GGI05550.1 alkylated DNA repair protein [Egicoccus halophilus]